MNLGRSWKRVAKHRHRAVTLLEAEVIRLSGQVVFWQALSNASPKIEHERAFDQMLLELTTLQTLLGGFQRDLEWAIECEWETPKMLQVLRCMSKRLCDYVE